MATAEHWLAKLARLKVDRAAGNPAPHKMLRADLKAAAARSPSFPAFPRPVQWIRSRLGVFAHLVVALVFKTSGGFE